MEDDAELLRLFIAEARDHLEQADACLRRLDEQPADREALQQCFRALHSLKGNSSYFPLPGVTALAHACEHLLDRVRAGAIPASRERCAALRDALVHLGGMLLAAEAGSADVGDGGAAERLAALAEPAPAGDAALIEEFRAEAGELLGLIDAALAAGLADDESRRELGRHLHTLKSTAAYAGHEAVEALARDAEAALAASAPTPRATAALVAALAAMVDEAQALVAGIVPAPGAGEAVPRLGDLLVSHGLPRAQVEAAASALRPGERLGDRLVAEGLPRAAVEGAAEELASLKRRAEGFSRVAVAKLEALVDRVGEALSAQAALEHALMAAPETHRLAAEALAKPLRELRRLAIDLRLVPVRSVFAKAERALRDASRRLDKPVAARLLGAATEIDRAVAEAISDPLIHLVRNAVDHGIEPAAARLRAGKDPVGVVTVSARQVGDRVAVAVADDGDGLDAAKLRRTAIARGLLAEGAAMSDAELHQLIFAPGFSTAAAVSDISGRGVGMDVVRRNIEGLGGVIDIETAPGRGTTVTMRVPATAALLDALVVRAGGERFLLPIATVLRVGARSAAAGAGDDSCRSLAEALSLPRDGDGFFVDIDHPRGAMAFAVDAIDGEQQLIAKPLDLGVAHHRALAAAAILPDGSVGLVLDPLRLWGHAA